MILDKLNNQPHINIYKLILSIKTNCIQEIPAFRDFKIRDPRHFVIVSGLKFVNFPAISGFCPKKNKKKFRKNFGNFLEFFLDEFLILFKIQVNSYLEHCQKIKFGGT